MEYFFILIILFVAFLYSSVGHGGASGYLALMAIFGLSVNDLRASALILNLFVAGIAFFIFYRKGYFRARSVLPFLITSMPMAFLGAQTSIDPFIYKIILALFLLIAVGRMLIVFRNPDTVKAVPLGLALLIGAGLGYFSGMIGIGGGIILTPVLLVFKWADVKEAAASSALFIWLNSATGLIGQINQGAYISPDIATWVIAAVAGALLGSYVGSSRLSHQNLRNVLAGVLLLASFKLFFF